MRRSSRSGDSRRAWLGICAALTAMFTGSCTSSTGPRAVVLIVVDTLRADRLSCMGYTGHDTPNIDGLARRGTTFTTARAVASWTIPSMGALLTSRYPRSLGLIEEPAPPDTVFAWRDRREQQRLAPPASAHTMAERFAGAGFATAAFVNQPGLNVGTGFVQGVDDWFYPSASNRIARRDPGEALPYRPWAESLTAAYEIDGRLVDAFAAWLRDNAERRTFAWIHLLTPHRPYNPIAAYASASNAPSARYDAEIRAVDDLIGRVVSAIEREIGFDDALVVFTSDHGEAFGEHGMEEHGHALYDEVIRVPLIVCGEGFAPGTRFDAAVRTIDVLPTMLTASGISDAARTGGGDDERAMDGIDLRAWMTGDAPPLPVFAEGMLYGSTEHALVSDDLKLIVDRQVAAPMLFELATDPGELLDVATRRGAEADRQRAALESLRTRVDAGLLAPDAPLDRDAAERALRSLGYIQ